MEQGSNVGNIAFSVEIAWRKSAAERNERIFSGKFLARGQTYWEEFRHGPAVVMISFLEIVRIIFLANGKDILLHANEG